MSTPYARGEAPAPDCFQPGVPGVERGGLQHREGAFSGDCAAHVIGIRHAYTEDALTNAPLCRNKTVSALYALCVHAAIWLGNKRLAFQPVLYLLKQPLGVIGCARVASIKGVGFAPGPRNRKGRHLTRVPASRVLTLPYAAWGSRSGDLVMWYSQQYAH